MLIIWIYVSDIESSDPIDCDKCNFNRVQNSVAQPPKPEWNKGSKMKCHSDIWSIYKPVFLHQIILSICKWSNCNKTKKNYLPKISTKKGSIFSQIKCQPCVCARLILNKSFNQRSKISEKGHIIVKIIQMSIILM